MRSPPSAGGWGAEQGRGSTSFLISLPAVELVQTDAHGARLHACDGFEVRMSHLSWMSYARGASFQTVSVLGASDFGTEGLA